MNYKVASDSPMAILMLGAPNWVDMIWDMFRYPENARTKASFYEAPLAPLELISRSKRSNLTKKRTPQSNPPAGEHRDRAGRGTWRCAYQSVRPSWRTQTFVHFTFHDNRLGNLGPIFHSDVPKYKTIPNDYLLRFRCVRIPFYLLIQIHPFYYGRRKTYQPSRDSTRP